MTKGARIMTNSDIAKKTQEAAAELIKKNKQCPGAYKNLNTRFLIMLSQELQGTNADFSKLTANCIGNVGYNYLHKILPRRVMSASGHCPIKRTELHEIKKHLGECKYIYLYGLASTAKKLKEAAKKCCCTCHSR